jgi:hypothetical protein
MSEMPSIVQNTRTVQTGDSVTLLPASAFVLRGFTTATAISTLLSGD